MTFHLPAVSIDDLRRRADGRVIAPDDEGYDEARRSSYGGSTAIRRPSSGSATPRDVAARRDFARETGLELAVRSGGHSGAGHGTDRRRLVLDLPRHEGDRHRPDGRTAWAGGGLDRRRSHDRAPTPTAWPSASATPARSGSAGSRPAAAIGYLARKHGLTIDSLLARRRRHRRRRAPPRRRRPRAGPVLGDPRRRRQLRRRHPLPVPAARGRDGRRRDAGPAGDGRRDRRRSSPRRRRRPRSCRPSPTSCPRRRCRSSPRSTTASWSSWRMIVFVGRRRSRRASARAVPGARRRRSPTWSGRCATRRCTRPRSEDYRPMPSSRTLLHGSRRRRSAASIVDRLATVGRADARRPAPGPRRSDGPRPADATAFAHRGGGSWPRRRFYVGPAICETRRAWVDGFAAPLDQGDPGAYVNFLTTRARSASAPRIPARPGTGSRRSSAATTRRTCSTATRTCRRRRRDACGRARPGVDAGSLSGSAVRLIAR